MHSSDLLVITYNIIWLNIPNYMLVQISSDVLFFNILTEIEIAFLID